MARREELTDEQWSLIELLFDKPPAVQTRGRPRRAEREVMNGVSVDIAQWREMVRLAFSVSAIPDLPPPIPAVGQAGDAQTGAGNIS